MLKGVLVAFGIMLLLAAVPLMQAFGPFIGGYFGISLVKAPTGSSLARGVRFGTLLGLLTLLVSTGVATALTLTVDLNLALLWLAVGVLTLHTAFMGALGAMYWMLRSSPPSLRLRSGQALAFPLDGGRDAPQRLS